MKPSHKESATHNGERVGEEKGGLQDPKLYCWTLASMARAVGPNQTHRNWL